MAKTVTINLAAPWSAGVSMPQDGDIFRESNLDVWLGSYADRIGYLKTREVELEADKAGAASDMVWSGSHIFNKALTPVEFAQGLLVSALGVEVTGGGVAVSNGNITVGGGLLTFSNAVGSGQVYRTSTGSDAAFTIDATYDEWRVPQLTSSRIWTVDSTPAPNNGRRLRVTKVRNDAFTLTLRREDATTIAVLDSGVIGCVELVYMGSWKVSFFGPGVSGVNTDI